MQKWEYLSVNVTHDERSKLVVTVLNGEFLSKNHDLSKCPIWTEFLTEKGREGWELAGFTTGSVFGAWNAIFKRPVESQVRSPSET